MLRLATCELMGRSVLLVEDDDNTADLVSTSIKASGGTVVGYASTLPQAVDIAHSAAVDMVLLHIRYVPEHKGPIRELFAPKGIAVEFLACFDDWFEFGDEGDDGVLAIGRA
jgi:DNA-binding NarL/FixJ family response regulator